MAFLAKIVLRLIYAGFVFAVTLATGLVLYAASLLPDLPSVDEIRQAPLNIPLRIYSSDRKLIAEYGEERRIPVTLDEVPPLLIDALLVTEDDRFYHHTGVDFPGIVRAAISNFMSRSRSQGASTITMQVARNFFLGPEKTYTRKLKEMLLAFKMERALTKDEILELYLNKIFLGHRSYGFAAAAQVYYGVSLAELSLPEICMLAGLPRAPSADNPISNPQRARERRAHVLSRLYALGRIDKLSLETASKSPLTAWLHVTDADFQAPYVSEMARRFLFERLGDDIYRAGLNVTVTVNSEYQKKADEALRRGLIDYDMRHGFKGPIGNVAPADLPVSGGTAQNLLDILSQYPSSREIVPAVVIRVADRSFEALNSRGDTLTIEWKNMQWARKYIRANSIGPELTSASDVVSAGDVVYLRGLTENNWMLSQIPEVSGALVSLDPNSGAILALVGGFDYYLSKFNRATQAERQPGSNIKPFIYSAALDNGFTPSSRVSAMPVVVEDDLEGIWKPQNYSRKFFGPTRLRKALSLSLNLVSVRLLRAMGLDTTIEHLARFGFDPEKMPRSFSLALGSASVTPLNLASSFAVFANGGFRVAPWFIEKIEDAEGNPVSLPVPPCQDCPHESGETGSAEVGLSTQTPERSLSAANAFLTGSIMKQVIATGTGRRAQSLNRSDLAGKTGTTNNFRDAWFSGFNSDVITTVFVGFDEPAHLGRRESGASAALPIWIDFMGHVLPDYPEKPEVIPENITTRFINRETAKPTSPDDPDGYLEYYLAGTEPGDAIGPQSADVDASGNEPANESLF